MDTEEQIKIMETQLANFESLIDKMHYLSLFFDPDPQFTQAARDKVRHNIMAQAKAALHVIPKRED